MEIAYDLGVNAAAAVLGAAGVATWSAVRRRRTHRHQRAFWRFLDEPTTFVVGALDSEVLLNTLDVRLSSLIESDSARREVVATIVDHIRTQELSGLIGRGDFEALIRIIVGLALMEKPVSPVILAPEEVGHRRRGNLVLIGSADVNRLTASLAPQMGCRLSVSMNSSGRNVVRDAEHGTEYSASDPGATTVLDYGVIARGRNPNNPASTVLVLAGAHGLGTQAAADVSLSDSDEENVHDLFSRHERGFECLVRYKGSRLGHVDHSSGSSLVLGRALRPARAVQSAS